MKNQAYFGQKQTNNKQQKPNPTRSAHIYSLATRSNLKIKFACYKNC